MVLLVLFDVLRIGGVFGH